MDDQQGPAGRHREVCSGPCGSLDGSGVWGESGYRYRDGWVPLLSIWNVSITASLITYTPVQNKKSNTNTHTHTEVVWIHSPKPPSASCTVNTYSILWGPRQTGEKPLWTSKEWILRILRVFKGEKLPNLRLSSDIQGCLQYRPSQKWLVCWTYWKVSQKTWLATDRGETGSPCWTQNASIFVSSASPPTPCYIFTRIKRRIQGTACRVKQMHAEGHMEY